MSTPPMPPLPTTAPLGPAARTGNTAFATSVALLLVRLMLGWTFIFHGLQHALGLFDGPGIKGFSETLSHMPLPSFLPAAAWAYIAAYGELLGGLSVFFGLLARLGTLPLLATMFVAIANVHAHKGFSSQNGGYEYNLNLIAESVLILIAGPGLISLDAFLFRRGFWAHGAQPLDHPMTRTK
jgi:putative oxidoreductase